jgi:hypothetical protein
MTPSHWCTQHLLESSSRCCSSAILLQWKRGRATGVRLWRTSEWGMTAQHSSSSSKDACGIFSGAGRFCPSKSRASAPFWGLHATAMAHWRTPGNVWLPTKTAINHVRCIEQSVQGVRQVDKQQQHRRFKMKSPPRPVLADWWRIRQMLGSHMHDCNPGLYNSLAL